MVKMKNDSGEIITGVRELLKPEYGTGNISKNGEPEINWSFLSEYADDNGFDKRNIEINGEYKIKINLPKDTIIIRYGLETGRFTAPKGTKYSSLALPYKKNTVEYNEYRVLRDDVEVYCLVEKGKVAPGFSSLGGAIQYYHEDSILKLLKVGKLERIIL